MSANRFGERFCVTTFGESHGVALGVVIDGCPAGVSIDADKIQAALDRRRPGGEGAQAGIVSARAELDRFECLSGIFEGKTLGTPIALLVRNHDARSQDYANLPARTGHADDAWVKKFGHADPRGGGRASGRETVARVMAGSVARQLLESLYPELRVLGFADAIGPFVLSDEEAQAVKNTVDEHPARFPSIKRAHSVRQLLLDAKNEGRSYGGSARLRIDGLPSGLGQPVFHKLKADLAAAYLGVGATSAVEIGDGASAAEEEGSVYHSGMADYGGLRGGITTGERLTARVTFKPTSSVLDVAKKGRHDPCIVPRAIPVLEAMTYLVLADHVLWARADRLS